LAEQTTVQSVRRRGAEVLLPSKLLFCLNLTYPAASGFLVLYARAIGIENVGWYFVASGSTGLLARPLLGRLGDKIGSGPRLQPVLSLKCARCCSCARCFGLTLLLFSESCSRLAMPSAHRRRSRSPSSAPTRSGAAGNGIFFRGLPLAAGGSALLMGSVVDIAGYLGMYLMAAGLGAAGLLVVAANWSRLKDSASEYGW
jgi:hypothetical protein